MGRKAKKGTPGNDTPVQPEVLAEKVHGDTISTLPPGAGIDIYDRAREARLHPEQNTQLEAVEVSEGGIPAVGGSESSDGLQELRDLPADGDTTGLGNIEEWAIDIKVYEPMFREKIPYLLQEELFKMTPEGKMLRDGYHTIYLRADEANYEEVMDWMLAQHELKVVGVTKISEKA